MRKHTLATAAGLAVIGVVAYACQALPVSARGPSQGLTSLGSSSKTEEEAVKAIGLNRQQEATFWRLKKEVDARSAAMKQLPSGHFEVGAQINQWWRASLQRLFTPKQWRAYQAYWSGGGVSPRAPMPGLRSNSGSSIAIAGRVGSQVGTAYSPGAAAGASPTAMFGDMESRILAGLNLTPEQRKRIDAHYAAMEVDMQELRALWKGTDANAVAWKGSDINKKFRAWMKEIMGPDLYAQYVAAWDEAMLPFTRNANPNLRASIVVNGQRSSAQFRPLSREDLERK
jgi:Spy/CpxP family protein refolding chaperone